MMKWIDKFGRSFWGETLMGAALICALIWFFGPLLGLGSFHPFASEFERIIAISVLVLLFVIVNLVHELRERKKEKELDEGGAARAEARQTGREIPPPAVSAAVVPVHRPA